MTMVFTAEWNKPKLGVVPVLGPDASNKQIKNRKYIKKNNKLRQNGAIFLTLFGETDVRNAIQKGHSSFNNADGQVKDLLSKMIGSSETITIDQGTHQEEDLVSGGFKLHFDARRPDNKCFHLYVAQNNDGTLKIIEISYMNGSTHVAAGPA